MEPSDPQISVIVPVYNAGDTLPGCAESILQQSFTDFELIFVDDGSTDASPRICRKYEAEDSRVKVISKPNGGVSSARNAGLDAARGRYVFFADADDFMPSDALESLYGASSAGSPDFVIGGFVSFERKVAVYPPVARAYSGDELAECIDDNYRFRSSLFRAVWGKLFKTSVIEGCLPDGRGKASGRLRFNEDFSYGEDVIFVWSYLMRCRSVSTVRSIVYIYSDTPGGLGSGLGTDRHLEQLFRFIPEYAPCLKSLEKAFPTSSAVATMYRQDLVGRLICRALTVFATRRTELLSRDNIAALYRLMDEDPSLSLTSLRKGQIPNVALYKLHCPRLSRALYAASSRVCTLLRIRPEHY